MQLRSILTRLTGVVALAFVLLLAACNRKDGAADALLQQKIVGVWALEARQQEDATNSGVIKFTADGTCTSGWTNQYSDGVKAWAYDATWQIKNSVLSAEITKAEGSAPREPIGHVTRFTIVNVDDHELVWEQLFQNGRQLTRFKRKE